MTAVFRVDRRGRPTAVFDPVEATLLRGLVSQLVELVEDGRPVATAGSEVAGWAAEMGLQDLGEPGPTTPPEDAVLARLLPDGYAADPDGDPDTAAQSIAEFRRLTENGLRRTKSSRARMVLAALGPEVLGAPAAAGGPAAGGPDALGPGGGPGAGGAAAAAAGDGAADPVTVRLEPEPAQAWLTVLTDLRLALATRLGITSEAEAGELEELSRTELTRARRARRRLRGARDEDGGDPRVGVYQVYSWLGYLQETLVEALS